MLVSSLSDRWMEAAHKVSLLEVLQAKAFKNKRPLWSPLISIPESGSLVEALRLMQRHSLTALPVFAYGGSLHDPQQPLSQIYKGILNISDILGLTVFQRVFEDVQYSELVDESTSLERFSRVTQQEEVLARTPVSDILGISAESARSHNQVFSAQDSLWTILQALVRDHRALITDPQDPSHVGMLTQTDLLSFIMENDHLKEALGLQ